MASALSEEEFHRLQLQLIELRTAKYELESVNKKQERELLSLKELHEGTEKELEKAQKAVNKSKKAKEVEILIQEADTLQRKLQSQEEDFRLQNQTLMQELSTLVAQNEDLEKQLASNKSTENAETKSDINTSHLEDEIRRLHAQNSALQKSVNSLQSKVNADSELSVEVNSIEKEENSEQDSESTDQDVNSDKHSKTIDEMRLSLDTELEEKRILKLELSEKEEKYAKEIKTLQEDVEKLNDKLKKKQESYLQLQTEKETLFKENGEKLQELQGIRDRDQKYYNEQINKLQQEIGKYQKLHDEIKSNADQTIKQLQTRMTGMQQQINAADIIESQHLQEKSNKYEGHIKELKEQILTLTQKKDDLSAQLEESQKASSQAADQLCSLQRDRDEQIQALQEANKLAEKSKTMLDDLAITNQKYCDKYVLAEKRKTMLDDLAITYQKDCDKHREQMLSLEDGYEDKLKTLESKLDAEKKKVQEMEKLKPLVEEQQTKLSSLEEAKGWLERRLEETEGSLDKTIDDNEATIEQLKIDHDETINSLNMSHSTEIDDLKTTFQSEIQQLKEAGESHVKNTQTLEAEIKKLKQELKDGANDKKIHEKKGKSVLKDLQKQLHAERRRAEKLQERLQEVLSSGTNNRSIEDLFKSPALLNESWTEDQSSISSWSGGGSRTGTLASNSHSAISTSPLSSPQSPMTDLPGSTKHEDGSLENENQELLSRLAKLQQDKWDLEEKVRHLETSTAAMANDLLEKSKVIEHYVMESRTDTKPHSVPVTEDKITLKKVLDLVNKGEDQGLKEMNKKLQNMLEETLTKNMHLQKDMETLSQEIVRLSKLPHQFSSEGDLQMKDKTPSTNHNPSTSENGIS